MSYRKFENFANVINAERDTYYEMEGLFNNYLTLYEYPSDQPELDKVQEVLNLMDLFAATQIATIEELFFGRKFNIIGDYIFGNDIDYFIYQNKKFYYSNLLELYNQLNEIVEQKEEANEIL